jgi:K+-transporting ATPase ATPase C chain
VIRNATRALVATLVLASMTGLAYPLAMTVFAQLAFPHQADGSPVTADGRTIGSSLIGQEWSGAPWFYGRPSAIATPYDASASSGSNLGPLSQALADQVAQRARAILSREGPYHPGLTIGDIPVELLTASGSGLDPDISPTAALFEAPRVAAARDLPLPTVVALINAQTSGPSLGFLGEPRVDVLELNAALATLKP